MARLGQCGPGRPQYGVARPRFVAGAVEHREHAIAAVVRDFAARILDRPSGAKRWTFGSII
ncbi:hypothetical protein MKK63_25905 [Methylobacterium sp. J-088]|nr:hypothetical protein [Methylobacterium sp. J-088]